MDEAFAKLRGYARRHGHRLTDLARSVATGASNPGVILKHRQR